MLEQNKAHLHCQCFYGDIARDSDMLQSLLTCIGHLGQRDRDRIISIDVMTPKVAKVSK
jgi:hypothetical protein